MTPDAQDKCRRLDVVTVKGSEVPIGIYTYDCLQVQQPPARYIPHIRHIELFSLLLL